MSQLRPTGFVDRLAERGLIDRWGFLSFALGGAAFILLLKLINANTVFVAVGAAALMVIYAIVVQRSGSGRLRSDQAGDNCYYLGLVYTLISLAYAIFTFDPAETATTIVQGFGIALSTTILGLVLRVFFHQSRPDLVQTEDTARIELAEAAGRLKAELSSVVVGFNDFGRQTRQSLEELSAEVVRSLSAVREASDLAIREASAEAGAELAEQKAEALGKAKRLSAASEKVVAGIERQAEVLERATTATDGISGSLASLERAAIATSNAMLAQAEQASELNRLQAEARATSSDLRDLVAALQSSVAAQRDAAVELSNQVAGSLSLTESHNRALEVELGKSREYVAKVHTALVAMTERLADGLEQKGS
jgi:hypothetical protein